MRRVEGEVVTDTQDIRVICGADGVFRDAHTGELLITVYERAVRRAARERGREAVINVEAVVPPTRVEEFVELDLEKLRSESKDWRD